jgi:hypothetical protein
MRWAEKLSKFSYTLRYRPGKHATLPDSLSRREQDESTTTRHTTVLRPNSAPADTYIASIATGPPTGDKVFSSQGLAGLWDEALQMDQEEYAVEEILAAKNARGRGGGRQVLVKWVGYDTPDWQPLSLFTDTEALDRFEARWGDVRTNNGPASRRKQGQKVRGGTVLSLLATRKRRQATTIWRARQPDHLPPATQRRRTATGTPTWENSLVRARRPGIVAPKRHRNTIPKGRKENIALTSAGSRSVPRPMAAWSCRPRDASRHDDVQARGGGDGPPQRGTGNVRHAHGSARCGCCGSGCDGRCRARCDYRGGHHSARSGRCGDRGCQNRERRGGAAPQ